MRGPDDLQSYLYRSPVRISVQLFRYYSSTQRRQRGGPEKESGCHRPRPGDLPGSQCGKRAHRERACRRVRDSPVDGTVESKIACPGRGRGLYIRAAKDQELEAPRRRQEEPCPTLNGAVEILDICSGQALVTGWALFWPQVEDERLEDIQPWVGVDGKFDLVRFGREDERVQEGRIDYPE